MSAHAELEYVAEPRQGAATPHLREVRRVPTGVDRRIAAALLGGFVTTYALLGVLIYVVVTAVV